MQMSTEISGRACRDVSPEFRVADLISKLLLCAHRRACLRLSSVSLLQLCEITAGCVGVQWYGRFGSCELYGVLVTGYSLDRSGCERRKCYEYVPTAETVLVCE